MILIQNKVADEPATPDTDKKTYAQKLKDFVPTSMSQDELTIYLVVAAILLIVCCALCFILKQILIFAIVITVFCVGGYYYIFIYRNKTE